LVWLDLLLPDLPPPFYVRYTPVNTENTQVFVFTTLDLNTLKISPVDSIEIQNLSQIEFTNIQPAVTAIDKLNYLVSHDRDLSKSPAETFAR